MAEGAAAAEDGQKRQLGRQLLDACERGNWQEARSLIVKGADTEVQDKYGWTPLVYACFYGHKEVASHLIEHGIPMASREQEYFILRTDVPIAKANNFLRNLLGTQNADHVLKGELLVKEVLPQDGSHQSHALYSLASDRNKKVSCSIADVIPLSEDDYEWLAPIRKNMDRWQVYVQGDKLESAKTLKVGGNVWVSLPVGDGNPHHLQGTSCCQATVQYIGPLQDTPGRWVGVELKDKRGSCDGSFRDSRYFICEDDHGIFLPASNILTVSQSSSAHPIPKSSTPILQGPHNPSKKLLVLSAKSKTDRDFYLDDRVVVFDKDGNRVPGVVKWASPGKEHGLNCYIIGIETDMPIKKDKVEGNISKMGHLFPHQPDYKKHTYLAIPEVSVLKEGDGTPVDACSEAMDVSNPPDMTKSFLAAASTVAKNIRCTTAAVIHEHAQVLKESEAKKEEAAKKELADKFGVSPEELDAQREQYKKLERQQSLNDQKRELYPAVAGSGASGEDQEHVAVSQGGAMIQEYQKSPLANRRHRQGSEDHQQAQPVPPRPVSHNLEVGSAVELVDPQGYGIIKWIGKFPDVATIIAGVELETRMDECGDGSWNGKQYFSCRDGHGMFIVLSKLKPDSRFVQQPQGDNRADTEVQDKDGQTPLMHACSEGHKDVVAHLLEHGADTEVQDKYGETPLMHACRGGHKDVASHLIEHGAQADVHSLYYAISYHRDVSLAKQLIEKGALASAEPGLTRTIYQAVVDENWRTAEELLSTVIKAPEMTTWRSDYERAVQRQGSITLDVIRTIFIGPSANGKSTLKHLLVHDESVDITRSTAVLETPAIVSLSSEQFAAEETSSSWKVVSDESMAACIRMACRGRDYQAVPLNPITRLTQGARSIFKHRGNEKKSGTKSKEAQNPIARPHSQPAPPEQEVLQPRVAMKQAHKALLDNLGTGVEDQLLQTARFVHLLDSGGQPPFQDALPLLLQVPCTYVLVFDASQDLDKPLRINYRCEGATEVEQAISETVWEMLLRLLSSVHTLAQKCSRGMADFQEKGGRLPQIRILLVGTFKDRLIKEGRLQEAIEELNKRIKSLEKKPYYKHIARDSNGQPFFLINNRMYLDAVGNAEEEQACLSDLRRLLSDAAASLKLQVPLGWFQFELVTRQVKEKFFKVSELQKSALKLKCVSRAKEFRSLLTLFHFLGFFTYFEHEVISDIVCTDNTVFLKEVSKLLAVQYLREPKTQAVEAFKEKGILTLDEHLADELGLSKELDRPWLLRVLCHLGLTACYAQSGAGLPKYFFPAALRSQGKPELAASSVEPLLVAFVFKEDAFDATHDMPRGIFCHLAVELAANRGWTVIPEQSTRLAIKFRWKELVVIIEESVGFIRIVPIVSIHTACDADKLHDRCHAVMSTIKEAVEESAQAVFGDQLTDRANVDLGFLCPCAIQSPHLAVPSGGSIVCQMTQADQRLLQAHHVWFSQVQGAELRPHPTYPDMVHLVDTTSLQTEEGGGTPQKEAPVSHPPPVMTEPHPMAKQRPTDQPSDQQRPPPNVAETHGSGEGDVLSQRVTDRPDCLILFRTYVSRNAAGKGRAVLEGIGLDSSAIEACFQSNPLKDEEAVQAGLIKWKGGSRQVFPPTWGVLIGAMEYAGVDQQYIAGLKRKLGLP